ncbi:excinuclease ABC subunit UvrB, partial [Patescibacteria group bacterium]|nr:excinuclease ABC subunit UvrB [Patescibacteria group bacterium]
TGSGKTFTMANTIACVQRPTLVISHNKTLAAQLYQEFRDLFPRNAVSYFVSYYDYYQPEAYIPQSDTYIEKETEINEEIDKLRLSATTNLLTRPDTIVVASVSSIYNIGSPREYGKFVMELSVGMRVARSQIFARLVDLQYERNNINFRRGTFRVRGETIDLFPSYEDSVFRVIVSDDTVTSLEKRNAITGQKMEDLTYICFYPAKHYMTDPKTYKEVFETIRSDLQIRSQELQNQGKIVEEHRLRQRVTYDLEMIQEVGYVNGIENYSRYFDGRNPGDPPNTLLDYFKEAGLRHFNSPSSWLLFIDESHMTVPQIRGMYNGDRSRKQTLIDYGFRLPAALDNRPLRFDEFMRKIPQTIYVSATPDDWEIERALQSSRQIRSAPRNGIVEQLVRPTGLVDPEVTVKSSEGQIEDLISEITKRADHGERVLVTTLTKTMAEDLSRYLESKGIRTHYLHSDVKTLDRTTILSDLRRGSYDVIIGVNLLREGLDLPEVSLVAILDADKEGFLRSKISLIQTMGRASRHIRGSVILYAARVTQAMRDAVEEIGRRRNIQRAYNKKHHVIPKTVEKPIRSPLVSDTDAARNRMQTLPTKEEFNALTPNEKNKQIAKLTTYMRQAGRNLDFELALRIKNLIASLTR